VRSGEVLQRHCNTLQHTATHCNTLNTVQHTEGERTFLLFLSFFFFLFFSFLRLSESESEEDDEPVLKRTVSQFVSALMVLDKGRVLN